MLKSNNSFNLIQSIKPYLTPALFFSAISLYYSHFQSANIKIKLTNRPNRTDAISGWSWLWPMNAEIYYKLLLHNKGAKQGVFEGITNIRLLPESYFKSFVIYPENQVYENKKQLNERVPINGRTSTPIELKIRFVPSIPENNSAFEDKYEEFINELIKLKRAGISCTIFYRTEEHGWLKKLFRKFRPEKQLIINDIIDDFLGVLIGKLKQLQAKIPQNPKFEIANKYLKMLQGVI